MASAAFVTNDGVEDTDGTVSWCCITNNTATGYNVRGTGVGLQKGMIEHSVIAFNKANNSGMGGGIGIEQGNPAVTIRNATVVGNSSDVGLSERYSFVYFWKPLLESRAKKSANTPLRGGERI